MELKNQQPTGPTHGSTAEVLAGVENLDPRVKLAFENQESRIAALAALVTSPASKAGRGKQQGEQSRGSSYAPRIPLPLLENWEKIPVKDWLASVKEWLDTGDCGPDQG